MDTKGQQEDETDQYQGLREIWGELRKLFYFVHFVIPFEAG
ncbi:MAG: hypothetical protein N0C79_03415 [Candidatus Thiodiazotropha taylori]|nr:hypothetical protein [Candidatus Thiodiazotropha taylori]